MRRSDESTRHRTETRYAWCVCVFLLAAIGLIYAQTLDHPLLNYDDSGFVFANPHVTPGLTVAGIRWAFTEGPYGEWYPLAPLSHMLDCQLFGLNAWGHHLTNVLLHAAASIALFLVLWRMTEALWPSAFVATIFAIHPQHVESVAWVAERRDVLSGLFFMLTLGAWLGYVRRGRSPGYYLLAAMLFALGLMAKPMLVTLPPLLILLDFWPLARMGSAANPPGWTQLVSRPSRARLILEKLPFFALALGDCLMTWRTHNFGNAPALWSERIGNAAVSCVTYVVQFFYPVDLVVFYPNPVGGPPAWRVTGSIAVLGVASAAAVHCRRRWPYFFVGWFWYLGMLTPVLGLVQLADHAMADRYMYLPGIGLYIVLAWAARQWALGLPARRSALAGCALLAIAVLVPLAERQTSFWRDDETLWRHALELTGENPEADVALGEALDRQGRREEAIAYYLRAEKQATDAAPFNSLGALLARSGNLDEAIAQYRSGLERQPDSYLTHVNLGAALARQTRFDEATRHLRRALEINPRGVEARIALAHLFAFQGKTEEARVELERAIAIDPYNAAAHNDLGTALFLQGKIEQSIPEYQAALAIDPNFVLAHNNLADALAQRGQIEEAIDEYRRALQIDPNNPQARAKLAELLNGGGKPPSP